MSKFNHLTYEERVQIDTLRKAGKSLRYIASLLGRSPNTISYELKNNSVKNDYDVKKANHKAYVSRNLSKQGCMKVVSDSRLCDFVHRRLEAGWSPERIAGRYTREYTSVSAKAVYKYIYSRCLEKYLFWTKQRKKPRAYKKVEYLKDERKWITERMDLKGLGHYEIDFIVSSKSKVSLLVVVDRLSRKVQIHKVHSKDRCTITQLLQRILTDAKSITTDNDIAFSHWKELECILNTKFFFTHPYCSWEKGLVENTNRWIRVDIPKKTDLSLVSNESLEVIMKRLNETPRKVLGYMTANEVEWEECPN